MGVFHLGAKERFQSRFTTSGLRERRSHLNVIFRNANEQIPDLTAQKLTQLVEHRLVEPLYIVVRPVGYRIFRESRCRRHLAHRIAAFLVAESFLGKQDFESAFYHGVIVPLWNLGPVSIKPKTSSN